MRRGVSITVTEEDNSFTISREIWDEWPGREPVRLAQLLDDVFEETAETLQRLTSE